MKSKVRERRNHRRVSVSRPLIYKSDIYPKNRVASTLDLCLGGARIEDASSLYDQEKLSLWFSVEPRVISCRGRVVHIQQVGKKYSAGISFEAMAEDDQEYLTQYLSDLEVEENPP
jgi:c-di-GMP-binding flagellar brake protein YcgR